ncbi:MULTISPECIES: helix-turn-helix domain-containing protein [Streptacidiphilus]|uniref:Helix-turn-helix domain-containing protein n=1 Tax=Streptacidiphilus cavernicola TaxID=3342716 RepID=A0ABV6UU44_9ACTN|nr:helix-turn-helix domain-containing protein [Streptacidiphilus jeojiense]
MDEKEFNAGIGARVRAARLQAKMTQEQLARRAGLTRGSVTNIESGAQAPPPYRLALLAEAVSVQPADLLPSLAQASPTSGLPAEWANAVRSVMSAADEQSSSPLDDLPDRWVDAVASVMTAAEENGTSHGKS